MSTSAEFDAWTAGQSYARYMGRWSRRIAAKFVEWLAPTQNAAWLEIGCGTGALTAAILAECAPRSVLAVDPSEAFVAYVIIRIKASIAGFDHQLAAARHGVTRV